MGLVMVNINEEAVLLAVILDQIRYSLSTKCLPLNLSGGALSLKRCLRHNTKRLSPQVAYYPTGSKKQRARRTKETDTQTRFAMTNFMWHQEWQPVLMFSNSKVRC